MAIIGAAVAICGLTLVIWLGEREAADAPRNLILISIDDLRADRLEFYGHERDTAPFLKRLAAQSVVFHDAITQFTSTRQSHMSILSGLYPFRPQVRPRLAEVLGNKGYDTAAYTGGGFMHRRFGFAYGFDVYFDDKSYSGLSDTLPLAIDWLRKREGQPFFLLLHTYDVHCPFDPPEPFRSMFLEDREPWFEIDGKCDNNYFNRLKLSEQDFQDIRALYDGGIRWVDAQLASLWRALEKLELVENTLIVVLSDHGERLGEHGDLGHGHVYEEEQRVPLIMRIPGRGPKTTGFPAQLVDVMPTVLATLGIEQPYKTDGINVLPHLQGNEEAFETRLRVSQSVKGHLTARVGKRWKLVAYRGKDLMQLFDLKDDPNVDVIEKHPMIAKRIRAQLDSVLKGVPVDLPAFIPDNLNKSLKTQLRSLGYIE